MCGTRDPGTQLADAFLDVMFGAGLHKRIFHAVIPVVEEKRKHTCLTVVVSLFPAEEKL